MILIVGLGNPGVRYAKTRHNAGFIIIEALAEKYGLKFKNMPKFQAHIAEGYVPPLCQGGKPPLAPPCKGGENKVIFALPMTFMNNSGLAVLRISQFYKIAPSEILVIHDDVDLPFGKLRVSFNSSSGGHNGIKSIISSLGTQKFIRLRVGIRNQLADEKKNFFGKICFAEFFPR